MGVLEEIFYKKVSRGNMHFDCVVPSLPDSPGVAFTDAEIKVLVEVDSEKAVQVARDGATDEKRALLDAEPATEE
jgi:hypothetical protein